MICVREVCEPPSDVLSLRWRRKGWGRSPSESGKVKRCLGMAVVIDRYKLSGQPVRALAGIRTRKAWKIKENRFVTSITFEGFNLRGIRVRLPFFDVITS